MKSKELAEQLLKYPDFDIKFQSSGYQECPGAPLIWDSWENIEISDIGHSDKVIVLSGDLE